MTAGAQPGASKVLADEIMACRQCPGMNEHGVSQAAPGYGSLSSPVVLVGQSLCTECMATGIPFTGGSGLLIDDALRDADLNKADIFTTNVVHCHPANPDNRKSELLEKERCRPFLSREIELVAPRLVIGLGGDAKEALRLLYPDAPELEWGRIDQWTSEDPQSLSFAYHPSYVKRPQRGETRQEREARQSAWVASLTSALQWSFRGRD
jgi:uracil-DNA glycosylase family 4